VIKSILSKRQLSTFGCPKKFFLWNEEMMEMRRCRRMGKNDEEKRNKLRNGMRIELEK
jgi:hypothetical protein